jgi:CheY-like chemotaxis protein
MARRQATVLYVEDEIALREEISLVLDRRGFRVLAASRPDEAMTLIGAERRLDLMITDLQLPMQGEKTVGFQESGGGRQAGLVLAREARRRFPKMPIIVWTFHYDPAVRAEVMSWGNARLLHKTVGAAPLFDAVDELLDGFRAGYRPRTFIVHGHDTKSLDELKQLLTGELRFPEPVVLREMASQGRTLIEKIESYSHVIDLVFVLLTPDDQVLVNEQGGQQLCRARQNVVFEMGYFLGMLGRSAGRVIVLHKENVELPSDILGMIHIDITEGVSAAAGEIKREVAEWLWAS